jgi:hypothetical protein
MSLLWVKIASQDNWETIGRAEHPNVHHYESGGIGHRPGDETRSVVGFVPTVRMDKYKDHDGIQNPGVPDYDRKVIDGIKSDIESGHGIEQPMHLYHDPKRNWGYLGEGNHRQRAATEAGTQTVPVRVLSRADLSDKIDQGIGAPLHLKTNFDRGTFKYTPPDIHPDHFFGEGGQWEHE